MAFHREIDAGEWRWIIFATTILLVVLTVPFIWAYAVAVPNYHFMGALLNPIDGVSYQARMVEGMDGGWRFHLPYTPEEHQGIYLYTFYLLLGHASRMLGVAPVLLFHTARLVGAAMMFFALYRFIADWTDSVQQRRLTWIMAALGGGLGWIAMAFNYLAPDMLQLPEAFPLQAAYANAHFPWGIACLLVVAHELAINVLADEVRFPGVDVESVAVFVATVYLASTSPFPLLPLGLGYGILLIWRWVRSGYPPREGIAWGALVAVSALPFAIYSLWATSAANPVFHAWYGQNVTLSPPVWAYVIGFGPLLLLAAVGIAGTRERLNAGDVFLLAWLVAGALALYAPLSVQRRFSMGLIVPLAIYAGRGLWRILLPGLGVRWRTAVEVAVFTLILPSTVFALLLPMLASLDQMATDNGGPYYISRSEERAMQWLAQNQSGGLVLASPSTSLFLPAYGQRVVCGHPMETVHAKEREEAVLEYYEGKTCSVAAAEGVDYVWVGPRERALADPDSCAPSGAPLYDNGDVAIYALSGH